MFLQASFRNTAKSQGCEERIIQVNECIASLQDNLFRGLEKDLVMWRDIYISIEIFAWYSGHTAQRALWTPKLENL